MTAPGSSDPSEIPPPEESATPPSTSDEVGISSPEPSSPALARLIAAWPYLLVLAVGAFVMLPALDFGFWDPWEPKYAETAREMIELDSYVTPYYRYDVRLTKPILVYWGVLAGSAVFGLNEIGARIVGVAFCLLTMALIYYAVSLMRGRQAGILAALVLGTVPQFYFLARQATPDVYLMASMGLMIVFLALGLFGPDRRRNLHFAISYAGFALAVLAKGPVIAGTIGIVTLSIYAVSRIDQTLLLQRGVRSETLRLIVASITGSLLLVATLLIAFLFGTSESWWGYSSEKREIVTLFRDRVLYEMTRLHLANALLVLAAVAALASSVYVNLRRTWPTGRRVAGVIVCALVAAAAVAALVLADIERKVAVAGLLGAGICAVFLVASVRRFMLVPAVDERLAPLWRPLFQQIGLFVSVFLVVAGPWHVAIVISHGHGYFTDFLIKHNVTRAVERVNSSGSTDFYLRTLIFGYFPWCCFIPAALSSLVSWWDPKLYRRYGFEVFLLIASAVSFTAFAISTTKFPYYLAPMVVPMAVLIGLAINKTLEHPTLPASRVSWIVASMFYLLPMADLTREDGLRYLVGAYTVKRWIPDDMGTGGYSLLLLLAGAVLMLATVLYRSRILVGGVMVFAVLLGHYYATDFIPALSRHKTMKYVVADWKIYGKPDDPIGFYGDLKHGIFFYTDYKVELLSDSREFMDFMSPAKPAFAVIEFDRLFKIRGPYEKRYEGQRLYVVNDTHFAYKLIANFPVHEGD